MWSMWFRVHSPARLCSTAGATLWVGDRPQNQQPNGEGAVSDFNLTRASYYTDFAVVPAMLGLALAGAWIGGLTYVFVGMAVAGYGGWTLFEYAMHRYAF